MNVTVNSVDITQKIPAKSFCLHLFGANRSELAFSLELKVSDGISVAVGMPVQITLDDNTLLWGGSVTEAIIMRRTSQRMKVSVRCKGYEHIVARRFSGAIQLSGETCGNIAKTLFLQYLEENAASGSEGFLYSANNFESGSTVSDYSTSGAKLSKIFDDLASASGFRWWTDKNKYFYFRSEIPVTDCVYRIDTTFSDPLSLTDISDFELSGLSSDYRNVQIVLGKGSIRGEARNEAEILRMSAYGGSGEYGNITVNRNIETVSEATEAAENILSSYEIDSQTVTFKTRTDGLPLFGKIPVTAPEYGISSPTPFIICEIKAYAGKASDGSMGLIYSISAKKSAENSSYRPSDGWREAFSQLKTQSDAVVAGRSEPSDDAVRPENIIAGDNVSVSVNGKNVTVDAEYETMRLLSVAFSPTGVAFGLEDGSTGAYTFTTDAQGRITAMTDGDGNVITVSYI